MNTTFCLYDEQNVEANNTLKENKIKNNQLACGASAYQSNTLLTI